MAENQVKVVVGPSSSQTPYVVGTKDGVWFTSILSVGDQVGMKADGVTPWRMVGIPDGLGAIDNGDGTITVLMNQELGGTVGVVREHGATGSFVSKLTIEKDTLKVVAAEDLIKEVYTYNTTTNTYEKSTAPINRLCSADLPEISAFYDEATGLGTKDRIFMNGEETGAEGRAFAHIVTGDEAGHSYELPYLGNFSWENSVASGYSGAKTVVIGTDDSTPGEVYLYVGDKQAAGSAIEKAGLTGGKLYGITAFFGDDAAATPTDGTFTLVAQGSNGDVSHVTGAELQAASGPITQFGRPEDGAWDPSNPNRFYFVTTGGTVNGAAVPTRLWALDFIDVEHPELGGTIKMLVEGGVGALSNSDPNTTLPLSLDNITVTESGLVLLQEDPGNANRIAKIWMYDPKADDNSSLTSGLTELAQHDPARFTPGLNTPAPGSTTGFGRDEESSGIIEVTKMLGGDKLAFLLDTQAHYAISGELVEGGQLQAMYVDLPNPGDSVFKGTKGADIYDGGFGNDRIDGGKGNDTLFGNYGDDRINGGDGNDQLDGGVGADKISGGNGNDSLAGGTGDDILAGDAGDDNLDGGVGNDQLDGGKGNDVLKGSFGNDRLYGGEGDDTLEGNQGADWLNGGEGNDKLFGGSGDDILVGSYGTDEMTGGEGHDTFLITRDSRGEVILDFSAEDDKLDLTVFSFKTAEAALAAAHQQGDDVVFKLKGGVVVTLADFDLNDLNAANIITHHDLLA